MWEGKVRIFWAGSTTHSKDVEIVDDALCQILDKHGPEKVEVHFLGAPPPPKLLNKRLHLGVWQHEGVHMSAYWKTLAEFSPHIVLAPMVDCPFNRSKSAIRVLDGMAINALVIASPVGEYQHLHDEYGGLSVVKDEDWFQRLDFFVEEHQKREAVANSGRDVLEQFWSWNRADHENRREWRSVMSKIIG